MSSPLDRQKKVATGKTIGFPYQGPRSLRPQADVSAWPAVGHARHPVDVVDGASFPAVLAEDEAHLDGVLRGAVLPAHLALAVGAAVCGVAGLACASLVRAALAHRDGVLRGGVLPAHLALAVGAAVCGVDGVARASLVRAALASPTVDRDHWHRAAFATPLFLSLGSRALAAIGVAGVALTALCRTTRARKVDGVLHSRVQVVLADVDDTLAAFLSIQRPLLAYLFARPGHPLAFARHRRTTHGPRGARGLLEGMRECSFCRRPKGAPWNRLSHEDKSDVIELSTLTPRT